MERYAWIEELNRDPNVLPSPLPDGAWEEIRAAFDVGDKVKARVAGRAPFGLWMDIGVGTPALMRIVDTNYSGFDYGLYERGEWAPLGTEVEVVIIELQDSPSQIHVKGVAGSWVAV